MGLLTFLGRFLIVTAVLSSAYFHLNSPEISLQEFQTNYATLDSLSQQYLQYDLPFDHANWKIAVKIFGAFEVFVVLMIVLGDGLGGTLYLLTLVFEIFFLLWGKLAAGSIAQWDNLQLAELSRFATLLGISLLLACPDCKKKAK